MATVAAWLTWRICVVLLSLTLAVKRLMKEAAELREPTEHYHAQPLEVGFLHQYTHLMSKVVSTHLHAILFLQDNLFEWHFSVRGPADSEFDGGVYHGRIVLPPEYPMKPPSIILLTVRGRRLLCVCVYLSPGASTFHTASATPFCTVGDLLNHWQYLTSIYFYFLFFKPNGRFEIGKKICLSISGHHPETWQPSWSSKFEGQASASVGSCSCQFRTPAWWSTTVPEPGNCDF